MEQKWISNVLTDMVDFAELNNLPETKRALEYASRIARREASESYRKAHERRNDGVVRVVRQVT